ncbi:Plasmid pRiA4b ORF-3-like protein [Botrimarina colliarenosi]|uniref:Plasmid pRiA4b ORF-3-like protein n=1 Tax=Botrimarina colliarenosi TaxID=2528001 RepID=A0A5C6AQA9_9BACT|nr:plasmid pRiA4b ORF-3 family protein [Botrimarina colliarenosi]TWU00384.1 Plasmid pRiA4b ORF-3-like protein [Botrimarina colliarenosi]
MASSRSVTGASDAPTVAGPQGVPEAFRPIYEDLVRLTDEFCNERLDDEYQQLCRQMAVALCQKGSPVVRGKREGWACGIVYTVGWVNFLQDASFQPHVRSEEIAERFSVSMATMHNKAKVLREGLDVVQLDPDWSVPSRLKDNPFVWLVEMQGGFIVDTRMLPPSEQQKLVDAGIIPFVHHLEDGEADNRLPIPVPVHLVNAAIEGIDGVGEELSEFVRATLEPQVVYKIKVTLDDVKPLVWRRLRVPDMTLEDLHHVLQAVFGWFDCHLHEFNVGKQRIVAEDAAEFEEFSDDVRLESDVTLAELVESGAKTLSYVYDFGDDWRHTIKIEKTLELDLDEMPLFCLAGSGACPPEDCGGPWGYADLLEGLGNPKHERHEELREWLPEGFDPNHFSLEETNEDLYDLFEENDDEEDL